MAVNTFSGAAKREERYEGEKDRLNDSEINLPVLNTLKSRGVQSAEVCCLPSARCAQC